MIRTVLLVAAIVSLAEGAALVRFINTVPTRFTDQSQGNLGTYLGTAGTPAKSLTNDASVVTGRSDRVGLQYFSQTSGTVAAPTLVWTTIVNSPAETGVATSPYAWYEAMPALRGYHTIRTSTADEAAAVDQPFGARANNAANLNLNPAVYDNYDQSRLRADGVGLYLSFAAGSYRMQAYAAISDSDATRLTATARPFTDSSVQLTLEDNKVYTLIAYGVGKYAETTPLNGNTVRLTLFEESVAPVTFGMASVRFFNGFAAAGVSVDVYSGTGVSDAARIASSIPVGGLSSYIDVTPGVQKEFPVAQTGSTSNYLASSTAVQRDVRAGSRTTIICAVNNEQSGAGFCRGIPSRVVAYVRFINDLSGQDSLVQGAFGAQKLSQTRLTLWASYEVPRPEILVEGSQVQGTQVVTGNPLTQEGLYPVIVSVAPGTVTGYGEVFVPVFIMDYAVRREIVYNPTNAASPTAATNDLNYAANPVVTSYIFAPIYKRVHFVIKTDGYATLSARQGTEAAGDIYEWPTVGTSQTMKGVSTAGLPPATGNQNGAQSFTTDEYVEPGEYYSVIATTPAITPTPTPNVYAYQRSDILRVFYRRDRTVDSISGGIQSGKGILTLIPFAEQTWIASAFSLQQGTTTTTPTMATVGVSTATPATVGPAAYPASLPNEIQLNTGAYTYSAAASTDCDATLPTTPTGITIADGQIYDLFVLNVYGCKVNGPSVSRLNVIVQQRGAVASANAPATSRRHAVPMAL